MKNRLVWVAVAALLAAGCSDGSDGADGKKGDTGPQGPPGTPAPVPPPTPTDPNLAEGQAMPGAKLIVTSLAGATGAGGQFQVGDPIRVTFTLTKGDGSYLGLDELDSGSLYISGPTDDYQRVIARQSDLVAASVKNADGSYTYTFASTFPGVYAAPYNDTAAFGTTDGEKTGQALANGTYTLGIEGYKKYFEGTEEFRDLINVTRDFLFGTATVLASRELVTEANCNACHDNLRVHGGFRSDVKLCVLCHTAGAEDRDSDADPDLTPGTTIELKVMIHKIHNAKHLPSVLGVGTKTDGSGGRDYGLTPKPYKVNGYEGPVDFSDIGFPVWPNLNVVMPRDPGYGALSSTPASKDDEIRRGATACYKCHGDPDAGGPLPAPAQEDFAYSRQTRRACGSCHDDIDWAQPYLANTAFGMPPISDDDDCLTCHPASGSSLSPVDAHVHPLLRPAFNPGLNFAISSLTDGSGNMNGIVEAGEKVKVSFTIKNDAHVDVPVGAFNVTVGSNSGSMNFTLMGPTTNNNLLYYGFIPLSGIPAPVGSVYTMNLPEALYYEFVGTSTGGLESFNTSRSPHHAITQAPTTVQVRVSPVFDILSVNTTTETFTSVGPHGLQNGDSLTASSTGTLPSPLTVATTYYVVSANANTFKLSGTAGGATIDIGSAGTGTHTITTIRGGSTLSAAAPAYQNYVDVASAANFGKGDIVVIDDNVVGKEEYLRVQAVEGNRVWFASYYQTFSSSTFTSNYQPFLRKDHSATATILEVPLTTKAVTTDYTLNAATGAITEVAEFGNGNDVIVTYVSDYVLPSAFPGTFNDNPVLDETWGEWVGRPIPAGTYTCTVWAVRPLQFDASGQKTDYRGSSNPGVRTFLMGGATAEVPYDAISSKDNCYRCHDDMYFHGGGRRGFDTCLACHGNSGIEDWPVYRGGSLVKNNGVTVAFRTMLHKIHMGKDLPDAETYVIFGNSGSANDFDEIGFPELINGVTNCSMCHGDTNTNWQSPPDRNHPVGQVKATRSWRATCGSCHSATDAQAHIDANTATGTNGAEACGVCHGQGKEWGVSLEHFNR